MLIKILLRVCDLSVTKTSVDQISLSTRSTFSTSSPCLATRRPVSSHRRSHGTSNVISLSVASRRKPSQLSLHGEAFQFALSQLEPHGGMKDRSMVRKNNKKTDENIVTFVGSLGDGTYIVEHADGRLERQKSKTDWARVDALTDKEVEASIADDPDWAEFKDVDWSRAVLVIPAKKKAISMRVDEDVLDYFKSEGDGYQRRMNAVLRSYMQQKAKPKKRA